MKTITEHDGKNVNMQVVGDLHQYPDGSVHTVKEGKAVWEEGSGDSGGSGGGILMVTDTDRTLDKTMGEIQDAYLAGKRVTINWANALHDVIGMYPVTFARRLYTSAIITYDNSGIELRKKIYSVSGETEEAAINAYPKNEDK